MLWLGASYLEAQGYKPRWGDEITPLFHAFSNSQLIERTWINRVAQRDHVFSIRNVARRAYHSSSRGTNLHPVFYQRNVTDGMCEPMQGVQDSTFMSGKRVSGCSSECPTKIICFLKEDPSESFEERRACQFAQLLV